MSIENGFANLIGRSAGGFSANIIGQVNYINDLQQGAGGVRTSGGLPPPTTPDGIVARMRSDPNFEQQAIRAVQSNPDLLKRAVMELAKRPDLARLLPPASKQFLISALTQR